MTSRIPKEERRRCRLFLSEWFGFQERMIRVDTIMKDEKGRVMLVAFAVMRPSGIKYAAFRKDPWAEWELMIMP